MPATHLWVVWLREEQLSGGNNPKVSILGQMHPVVKAELGRLAFIPRRRAELRTFRGEEQSCKTFSNGRNLCFVDYFLGVPHAKICPCKDGDPCALTLPKFLRTLANGGTDSTWCRTFHKQVVVWCSMTGGIRPR